VSAQLYDNAVGSGWLKEPCVKLGHSRSAQAREQLLVERRCPGMSEDTALSCAKVAEQVKMLFGFWLGLAE